MRQLAEYSLAEKSTILVEVEVPETGGGFAHAGRAEELVRNAVKSLDTSLEQVKAAANLIITKLMTLAHAPEETSVELGFKLGAEGSAILVSTSTEGHFKLKMTWKRQDPKPNA